MQYAVKAAISGWGFSVLGDSNGLRVYRWQVSSSTVAHQTNSKFVSRPSHRLKIQELTTFSVWSTFAIRPTLSIWPTLAIRPTFAIFAASKLGEQSSADSRSGPRARPPSGRHTAHPQACRPYALKDGHYPIPTPVVSASDIMMAARVPPLVLTPNPTATTFVQGPLELLRSSQRLLRRLQQELRTWQIWRPCGLSFGCWRRPWKGPLERRYPSFRLPWCHERDLIKIHSQVCY